MSQHPPAASLGRRAAAEAIATFTLVFAGCGAVVVDHRYHGALGTVGIAMVFGLVVTVMIYATGHISGAHINPAVTIAFALTRHLRARDAIAYAGAQLGGAMAGALVLLAMWSGTPAHLGATVPSVGPATAVLVEAVLTALLMFVIMSVTTDTRAAGQAAALAIGGTIALGALVGGPISGASMNPARSLGPGLVSGEWQDLWVYLVGPVIGAAAGAVAYQLVCGPRVERDQPALAPREESDGSSSVRLPA